MLIVIQGEDAVAVAVEDVQIVDHGDSCGCDLRERQHVVTTRVSCKANAAGSRSLVQAVTGSSCDNRTTASDSSTSPADGQRINAAALSSRLPPSLSPSHCSCAFSSPLFPFIASACPLDLRFRPTTADQATDGRRWMRVH